MSKLIVEICKVNKIEKHPNADKLDIIGVKGWNCIVGRDNHKVGDLVIYCPPDSVIPDDIIEKYNLEFLKKNGKVGTIKLRKCISQGLILDIDCLSISKKHKIGQDVANELGITKYEPPASPLIQQKSKESFKKIWVKYIEKKITLRRLIAKSIGIIKDKFKKRKNLNSLFTKYTDIDNIKNFNTVFTEEDLVVITEKCHGTNFRASRLLRGESKNIIVKLFGKIMSIFLGKYEFIYGSHNVQLIATNKSKNFYGEDVYGKIAKKYKLAEIIPEDYILYGEIYGKGIQKKYEYGLTDIDVKFFDIKYKGKYLDWCEVVEFCLYRQLPIVPILYCGKYSKEELIKCTVGQSTIHDKTIREGAVVKTVIEEIHTRIGRKILKSINPDYLLIKNKTEHH